jgi:hypothetical protein
MTTEKIYKCNFCRGRIHRDDAIGIYWANKTSVDKRHAGDCENHLCENCFGAIGQLYIQVQEG